MSPRKRTISDFDVITIAGRVVAERGVEQVRLADVAAAAQLAAPTLVQRFGSRAGLLAALATAYTGEVTAAFQVSGASPLERLGLALHRLDAPGHLRFFSARPDGGAGYALELRKNIGICLAGAVDTGELIRCDVAEQAARVQRAYLGLVGYALLHGITISLSDVQQMLAEALADYQ